MLVWSKALPIEPGFYWRAETHYAAACVVEVHQADGYLVCGGKILRAEGFNYGEWAGPIPLPECAP